MKTFLIWIKKYGWLLPIFWLLPFLFFLFFNTNWAIGYVGISLIFGVSWYKNKPTLIHGLHVDDNMKNLSD